ncbi:hypothetical protein GCM10011609_88400 [Lentzea pudingi]|uniref:Uncharacterized protein n=1 Tax=Lentzea pudingi TaxID=1789439 RepID=A0ABQ2ITX6_9PSEU|nr:hypothetical protein GCM10011609_88400 [Lentzea pudingi]
MAHRDVAAAYRQLKPDFFVQSCEAATRAARRLFDYINILYVLLNLTSRTLADPRHGSP